MLRKENFSIKGSIKFNCNLGLTATGVDICSSKLSYILAYCDSTSKVSGGTDFQLSRGYTSDFLLAPLIRFCQILSRRLRARVATLGEIGLN